ncbi:divalent-cation tolerance protein CutA [bacterium]|nr:divalent-cation tolerance protein CutA [candidate division CSSED10-310 bacterium]
MHPDYYIVLTTAATEEIAASLARMLVEKRLARCVNIIRNVRSIYSWQGEICDESECMMMIKTGHIKLDELMEQLREKHPYELPEILALPIETGDEDFLRWVWDWVSAEM